ncbi:hypothetical protein OsccyDRAFT_3939 [Leptolyngbyaceae cyanobacterium JSC-12]|nr:hypothetical protein OsccyDRAFT_3939 [Leptolyngbyaceae cyanobacterium JSC-12]
MPDTHSVSVAKPIGWLLTLLATLLVGCDRRSSPDDSINLQVYQKWQLQPGTEIKGYKILAGLGDISIALDGKSVYAPFDGRAQKDQRECLIFSSPDVPAYLFRLCGLANLHLREHRQGDIIGSGSQVHIATLRKQPDGTWAIVEPSIPTIEKFLTKS